MSFLNPSQKHTLDSICDTLVPALEADAGAGEDSRLFGCSASALNLAELMEVALERATDESSRRQLRQFLGLIESAR